MKQFTYTISDPLGVHARPAGLLAKLAKSFPDTTATLTNEAGKTVKLSQLMMLMGLAIKKGQTVTVTVEGAAEEEAHDKLLAFFQETL